MSSLLVDNVDVVVTGVLSSPLRHARQILIVDGRVAAFDPGEVPDGSVILDAAGGTVLPGFVDGHVHPVSGEWTPVLDAGGWVGRYLHGGTTSLVSAGELHLPGLRYDQLTPDLVTSLAVVNAHTSANQRWSGAKLYSGTVLLVPGMEEQHFDRLQAAGCRLAKFLFYPFDVDRPGEALRYTAWARERGMRTKVHAGGVSRSGASQPLGYDALAVLEPDVVAHVSGGPIPVSDEDIVRLVHRSSSHLEVCTSGNAAATVRLVTELAAADGLHRLTVGTDTPGGTGVVPRGMLRNVAFLASLCGLDAAVAVAAATGNTGRAHGLEQGTLEIGAPADLVVAGPVTGSAGADLLGSLQLGDLPAISHVVVDGEVIVDGRSDMTPPRRPS